MLKAVILDNQAVARNLLTSVLQNGGHEVVADGNTSSASLARVVKLRPQIVCVDIGEADTSGVAILDALHAALPKALIFLVSSKIDAEKIQITRDHGVSGYIVKPFNAFAVLTSIRSTIVRIVKQQNTKSDEESLEPIDMSNDDPTKA